jgi:putative MATE family efflux protein
MATDLTEGRITPQLVKFTIPLVLGNLFQLTYNAVDSIIVGRFVGKEALAAVGICNPISTLFILFLNGLCMGASILMGNQFGAKDYDRLHRQISTTMISGCVFSLILSALCIIFAQPILSIMQVDPSIMGMTTGYMRIIFAGLIFTFMYNCFASTLRALGDSKSPLYFLIISSLINIVGDLFFVVARGMGSRGCAISTVLSEAISCLLCVIYIQIKVPVLQLGRKWLIFDRKNHIIRLGICNAAGNCPAWQTRHTGNRQLNGSSGCRRICCCKQNR